jgi:hypothetical protein
MYQNIEPRAIVLEKTNKARDKMLTLMSGGACARDRSPQTAWTGLPL